MSEVMPCAFKALSRSRNSSWVCAPKLPIRIYPTVGLIIYEASIVFTGILSRMISKCSMPLIPRRTTPKRTNVPFRPRSLRMISSRDIFTPAIAVSLTVTILSPAMMPFFSDGPPTTGCITSSVSSDILNCTPMPSKLPCSGSLLASTSFAVR